MAVKEFEPNKRLVWGDRQGKSGDNSVTFSMVEKIGGLFFPMYAKYLPPFDDSFEQFAADLKNEAEAIQQSK